MNADDILDKWSDKQVLEIRQRELELEREALVGMVTKTVKPSKWYHLNITTTNCPPTKSVKKPIDRKAIKARRKMERTNKRKGRKQ